MMYPKSADSLPLILLTGLPFPEAQVSRLDKRFNVKPKTARKEDLSQHTKWGEKHIIVSTFPKV